MKTLRALTFPTLRHAAATALSLLLLVGGCGRRDAPDSAAAGAAAPAPVRVEVATAELAPTPASSRVTGSVEPIRRVQPGSKIFGRVERVTVREGDRVERGQLLARLESRDLAAAVDQAKAAVDMAKATLENAQVQERRMRDLHSRGSVTDKNLEDAAANFAVSAASLAQAQANLAAAEVMLGYAEIRSPLTGWVVAKHVEAGDVAPPGTPFFTLEDLSQAKVTVEVPEGEVAGLSPGDAARVTVLDRDFAAAVDRVVPAGDPASRTFAVQLLLDNPDGFLKSGMFARVAFSRGEREALTVPAGAVVRRGQLTGVFVVDGDRARLRWVRTGAEVDGRVEVLSGLTAGERYVVAPPPELADGAVVEVAA